MPSSVVGTCTTGTPRSQVAATKPAEVGRRPTADGDQRIGAGETVVAQAPTSSSSGPRRSWRPRRRGSRWRSRWKASDPRSVAQPLAGGAQTPAGGSPRPVRRRRQARRHLLEQAPADDDGVGARARHLDRSVTRRLPSAISATTSATVAVRCRRSAHVAWPHSRRPAARCLSMSCNLAADVAQRERPRDSRQAGPANRVDQAHLQPDDVGTSRQCLPRPRPTSRPRCPPRPHPVRGQGTGRPTSASSVAKRGLVVDRRASATDLPVHALDTPRRCR